MPLNTHLFVTKLIKEGYTHLCVVPCSFAKNIINEVINNKQVEYVPCANEGVACSIAAGLKMATKKPIVMAQSSGATNMGSCITSLLQPYGITFPMIISWRTYKEGDSEVQHKHLATQLPCLIEAYGYRHVILSRDNVDIAIEQINQCNTSHTMCILKDNTFTAVSLDKDNKEIMSHYVPRSEYLKALNNMFRDTDSLFIGTTGHTAREMHAFMKDTNNFYMAGNMGGALSIGLGASIAGKKVVVCGGDAEFVMHMGGITTAGRYKNINMIYIVFDNEANKSTGGQNTYQGHVDYISIARASGFKVVDTIVTNVKDFRNVINCDGLTCIHVKCDYDEVAPRPPVDSIAINRI